MKQRDSSFERSIKLTNLQQDWQNGKERQNGEDPNYQYQGIKQG